MRGAFPLPPGEGGNSSLGEPRGSPPQEVHHCPSAIFPGKLAHWPLSTSPPPGSTELWDLPANALVAQRRGPAQGHTAARSPLSSQRSSRTQVMARQGGAFAFSLPAGGPQIPRAQLRPSLRNDANQTGWSLIVISLLTSITLRGRYHP